MIIKIKEIQMKIKFSGFGDNIDSEITEISNLNTKRNIN